jgi:hypothetical protein
MTKQPKLTSPQEMFLFDLQDFQGTEGMYVHETYKPALKLVELGLARWRRPNMIEVTKAGSDRVADMMARSRAALLKLSQEKANASKT